jgi:hypothetical protein
MFDYMLDQETIAVDKSALDVQDEIRAHAGDIPNEVWEALESVKPFLMHPTAPSFAISMIGTSGVV